MAGNVITGAAVMAAAQDVMMTPWQWGVADCCTSASDVFLALHGFDPMAGVRGAYSSQEGADATVAGFGGFLPMVTTLAKQAGLVAADGAARPGDIGVTHAGVHEPDRRALAVCAGPGAWVAKSPRGMTIIAMVEHAWRMP